MSDFNSDIEDLINNVNKPRQCSVGKALSKIDSEHGTDVHDKLVALIENPDYSSARISTLLKKHNYKVGRDSITRHRRKGTNDGCICSP